MDDAGTTPRPEVGPLPREIFPGVRVCADLAEVARAAARLFVDWAWQAIALRGWFAVALSGGGTPREFYRLLGTSEFRAQVDWARVELFWGDERAVPPDDPESNYGMARREFLLRVPIPPGNVHRMQAERTDIGRAAHEYEALLRERLPLNAPGLPRFDLILLGVGRDGHTASLFPRDRRSFDTLRWVSTPQVEHLGARRMTLTLPVLNAARQVLFQVTGSEKAEILRQIVVGRNEPRLPAQLVTVPDGERQFLVDEEAAALLLRQAPALEPDPKSNLPPTGASREGQ